jgi:hypothetical protein
MNITPKDLVTYQGGDGTYSGGYKIDGFLKSQGISPLTTMNGGDNNKTHKGGDVNTLSEQLSGLGIPAGLSNMLSISMKDYYDTDDIKKSVKIENCNKYDVDSCDYERVEAGLLPASLYDRLLELAGPGHSSSTTPELSGGDNKSKNKKRSTRRKNNAGGNKNTKELSKSGKKRKTRKNRD